MAINVDGTRIRPCSTGTVNVYYQNRGTIDANNPMLEVTLDAAMAYVSATQAPVSVMGNVLKFELGQSHHLPIAERIIKSKSRFWPIAICGSDNIYAYRAL